MRQPRPADFLRFLRLPFPFRGFLFRYHMLASETYRLGAGAQFADGALGNW